MRVELFLVFVVTFAPCVVCSTSGGHLKWMFDATDGYAPYNTPFVPAILRGESVGDERVAVLSRTLNGNWAVDGLRIADGTLLL